MSDPGGGRAGWEPVIGLEVHCQLSTRTKLFCRCAWEAGAPPNSRTCPVCTGQPGALPVLSREALELGVRAALALSAELAPWSRFDRKGYFYFDLPKGYQITQQEHPLATGGEVPLVSGRRVPLLRMHLEEDAGKAIHDRGPRTLVDLDRAGVPLLETVTGPVLGSAEEACELLASLREILRWCAVSDGDMEKGSLRCDVNVSVRRAGEAPGPRVELKNLNSFRHVRDAIEHEVARQVEARTGGGAPPTAEQETRLWDPVAGESRPLRGKEGQGDYRFFPEPDLPPIRADAARVERQRSMIPELPAARRERFRGELGLSAYDARVLCADRALSDFFEAAARLSGKAKRVANWVSNEVLAALSAGEGPPLSIDELSLRPGDLAELSELVDRGAVGGSAARALLREMLETGRGAAETLREMGLEPADPPRIEAWCREALVEEPELSAAIRSGRERALDALVGSAMRRAGGRADGRMLREILLRLIEEGP